MRKLVLILQSLFIVTLFLWCIGALYQRAGFFIDAHRIPQREKSFQAGSVKLNMNCSGQGPVTVVLDSGLGSTALDWILVQPQVAAFTRVCSYDRAGYGWSGFSTEPRTSLQIAKELKLLLDAAKEKGPYVLVGHSFGGYNVRCFAELYPAEVAGTVLVNASHPDEERLTQALLSPK